MPQPLRVTSTHTLTIDLGDGTNIPLGVFAQDQDGQLDNGTGAAGYLDLRVDGHYYGTLWITATHGHPEIRLGAWNPTTQNWEAADVLDGTAAEPED